MHFLINRSDNIGDVILTMPLAGQLKRHFPDCKVSMIARNYVQGVVEACQDIDCFISSEALFDLNERDQIDYLRALKIDVFIPSYTNKLLAKIMKKARVPLRFGHIHRYYYFWTANKILWLKRKRSGLHQAQMSMQFLKAFNMPYLVPREELHELIHFQAKPDPEMRALLDPNAFNLVIHPGSNGNAVEWPKSHFAELIHILPKQVTIYLTGSEKEAEKFNDLILNERVIPLFGKLTLDELISFLAEVDGLVVGSTGPLHVAAALGTPVLGLFPDQQDMNIERWGPLGKNASALEAPHCVVSRAKKSARCDCIKYITPVQVRDFIVQNWMV
ncbi:MAG: glycosyltransferase family 9 protein [Gammaproteobacteria bacterium]|nr:glycosyltransferase family 9 protein [Gammaproteobacteria bacterium]